mgnify:FL=1
MPKVYNKHHKDAPPDAVYVGRPSKWGNPFVIGKDGDREKVIEEFHYYILDILEECPGYLDELKGKDLVCFCAPKPCHADILLEIANS